MWVEAKSGNHMPVNVRNHISKAGEVNFLRIEKSSLCSFCSKYDAHQFGAFGIDKVSHLTYVSLHNDPAESRVVLVFDVDDTCQRVGPDNLSAGFVTQHAAT